MAREIKIPGTQIRLGGGMRYVSPGHLKHRVIGVREHLLEYLARFIRLSMRRGRSICGCDFSAFIELPSLII